MAKKPTKQQVAYGKARAGGQDAYKITAKEVKRTAKGVAKAAGLAATVVGPGKFIKAAKVAKAATAAKSAKKAKDAAETARVAKNTVKVTKAKGAVNRLEKNSLAEAKVMTAKTGAMARFNAGQIEKTRVRPAKVIKIKSK
jgi:hypothetical protein